MADKRITNVGNFSNGMVPDVIGASDSMVDIKDGWIPRIGEIRKRGGKSTEETVASPNRKRAGQKITDLVTGYDASGANDPGLSAGWAFVGNSGWWVKRSSDANPTALSDSEFINFPGPFPVGEDIFYGGGDQIKNYGTVLVSTGNASPQLGIRFVGIWGGALANSFGDIGSVELTQGSRVATRAGGGTFNPASFPIGSFIQIDRVGLPAPNTGNRYQVVDVNSEEVILDRPWSGPTNTDYIFGDRTALTRIGDPFKVGVNGARVVETHQDRLFLANFNPLWSDNASNKLEDRAIYPSRVHWSASYGQSGADANSGSTISSDQTVYGEHLYYEEAFIDVFPGQGGQITGMHSMGNTLVILKEDAVYALRGAVSTRGFDSGASVDVVVHDSGSKSFRGSAKTEVGIAWANDRGLWIFDGSSVTNLVDSVLETRWNEVITDFTDCVVSGANERIIVQSPSDDSAWVYHTDKQYFTRQECQSHTNVIPFGDQYFGEVELAMDDDTFRIVDWSGDFRETLTDDEERAGAPLLEVETQPLLSDDQPFFNGRINLCHVSGRMDEEMRADIYLGRSEYDEFFRPDDQGAPLGHEPLEYGVKAEGYDRTSRIPVNGIEAHVGARLRLTQEVPSESQRLYGVGVEHTSDYVAGSNDG